jgi:hypothetical protein
MTDTTLCRDCGIDTMPDDGEGMCLRGQCENYIVKESVWKETGLGWHGGRLCIGCLEKRIGRQLKPGDFTPTHNGGRPSSLEWDTPRLAQRKGHLEVPQFRDTSDVQVYLDHLITLHEEGKVSDATVRAASKAVEAALNKEKAEIVKAIRAK